MMIVWMGMSMERCIWNTIWIYLYKSKEELKCKWTIVCALAWVCAWKYTCACAPVRAYTIWWTLACEVAWTVTCTRVWSYGIYLCFYNGMCSGMNNHTFNQLRNDVNAELTQINGNNKQLKVNFYRFVWIFSLRRTIVSETLDNHLLKWTRHNCYVFYLLINYKIKW